MKFKDEGFSAGYRDVLEQICGEVVQEIQGGVLGPVPLESQGVAMGFVPLQ